jgi:ssDNA-binding Zn-finger/Zn-ribbon topoisomerase 1
MNKACPACGGSISLSAHMARSETADYECPTCHAKLDQKLSAFGKLLAAGWITILIAGIVMHGPTWWLAVAGVMGFCAWRWGSECVLKSGDGGGLVMFLLGRMKRTCPACGASISLSDGRRGRCPSCRKKLEPVFKGPAKSLIVGGSVIIFWVAIVHDSGHGATYAVPLLLLAFVMLICGFAWGFQFAVKADDPSRSEES